MKDRNWHVLLSLLFIWFANIQDIFMYVRGDISLSFLFISCPCQALVSGLCVLMKCAGKSLFLIPGRICLRLLSFLWMFGGILQWCCLGLGFHLVLFLWRFYFILFILFYFIFGFLGPKLWHMEVSRLEVEYHSHSHSHGHSHARSKPYLQTTPQLKWQIINWLSMPGIKPTSSCILVRFISNEQQGELP